MNTIERDLAYIAKQVKFIRKMFRLTQENLADAAGLTTRTIEKVESGRHRPDEQTLRSIARAVKIDIAYFQKPTPEQEARQKAEMERALRKMVLVPTDPIRTAQDFLSAFGNRHAFRFDLSQVQDDQALEIASTLVDWATDLIDVWAEIAQFSRLEYARDFIERCAELEALGYLCHMGMHRQVLREQGRPDLIFVVGLMCFLPKEGAQDRRYGLVELEGRWETLAEDRAPVPEHFFAAEAD